MKYDCRPLRDADICFWNSLTCCSRIYTEIRQPQFSTHTRETGCTPGTRVDLSLAGAQTKWFKSAIKTICAHSHRWVDTVPTDGPNESQRENLDRKRKCNRYFQRVAVMIWAISLWSEKPIESREPRAVTSTSAIIRSVECSLCSPRRVSRTFFSWPRTQPRFHFEVGPEVWDWSILKIIYVFALFFIFY